MTCSRCEETARAQAEAMQPREEIANALALVIRSDGLKWIDTRPASQRAKEGELEQDLRIGDIIRVTLIAGAVPDGGFCDCENDEEEAA